MVSICIVTHALKVSGALEVVGGRRHKALVSSEGVIPSDWQPWPFRSVSLMHSVITRPYKIFSRWCAGVGID